MDITGCFRLLLGFFDSETSKNWTWFFEQLQKAIGNPPILSISSDACKGLENAVKKVYLGQSTESVSDT